MDFWPRGSFCRLAALLALLCAPLTACGSPEPQPAATAEEPQSASAEDPSETADSNSVPASAPATAGPAVPAPAGSPEAALETYIRAQEVADWAETADCLTTKAQDDFDDATENMDEDDLIEAGLRMREENYRLDSSDESTAIFFSRKASLYLVMTREDARWKVDPHRTDQMNLEGD